MACDYTNIDKDLMKISQVSKNKSRLQELIDFAKNSGYKKIGVANCFSMQAYADKLIELLEGEGFEVSTVNCKESGLDGCEICDEMSGPCCDPISQASFLNQEETELNINVGLCLGHGLLFQKYSEAPVTTFVVKDVKTGHHSLDNLI